MNRCDLSLGVVVLAALAHLAVNLRGVQVDGAAEYSYSGARQSLRRVQTAGIRGRILARDGSSLAENRACVSIVCDAAPLRAKTYLKTADNIEASLVRLSDLLGREIPLAHTNIYHHVKSQTAVPLVIWRNLGEDDIARFAENSRLFPGFSLSCSAQRRYPMGAAVGHLTGYVGRSRGNAVAGDQRFYSYAPEMVGRAGLEAYYDDYLRGVSGDDRVLVDSLGYAVRHWTVVAPQKGPDLVITIDPKLQLAAMRELSGCRGACVVMDPRNGEVLAMASSPSFDPNVFVPFITDEEYSRLRDDSQLPLLNRAVNGTYAPGSTFKPITAIAGLSLGYPELHRYECSGVYQLAELSLRCSRRWGHGELDLRHALMASCNPFFCNLGMDVGTNQLLSVARDFGLGSRTGIDFPAEPSGVVPDAEWKWKNYRERWYPGDLAQLSIGQGMLLVSPLQMARVAGALGTGYLTTPHLRYGAEVRREVLPFSRQHLRIVQEGMRMVVTGEGHIRGTGWRGGEGVPVHVSGKTGTAEIGSRANRRKNTWFIAYAPSENPSVAVALVVENGESGGSTAAPRCANILRECFR